MTTESNRRILLIDDNESIHEDFKKILLPAPKSGAHLANMRAAFLTGNAPEPRAGEDAAAQGQRVEFEITSALQGEEGYESLCVACDRGEPFAMAFVDMRMPPGWDGVKTIAKLWERDPDLQVVICTAFSDYTWEETAAELGQSEQLLILKKPFDAIEIYQLAAALTRKWDITVRERKLVESLRRAEQETRAYATSLETVNSTLVTAKAAAEMAASLKTEFLIQLGEEVSSKLVEVLGEFEPLCSVDALAADEAGHLEAVLDVGYHLMNTISEILDVTTLETGARELQVADCDPAAVAESVLDSQRAHAAAKGLTLELAQEDSLPGQIQTDEHHLRKLLDTLVDNAINNTDAGAIRIALSLQSTESWQHPNLVFEIIDPGRGIPRERLGRMFEPAPRAEEGATRSGYGFHLTLAKRLAALLGGSLEVRSELGRGSTFVLTLEACGPRIGSRAA